MQSSNFDTGDFGLPALRARTGSGPSSDAATRWSTLAETAILVLGSPRSGTTWLAKIFDSHPDSIYRHEPDEIAAAIAGALPSAQIAAWLEQRKLRAAAKRPFFRKSWRTYRAEAVWRAGAIALALAARWEVTAPLAREASLPDLMTPKALDRGRAVIKLVSWDGSAAARSMPNTRCVFILRHPCGQVASVIDGLRKKRLSETDDDRAVSVSGCAWAARHGIDQATFNEMPLASRLAWAWRAFNEPAVASLAGLPNAKVLVYEDLCRDPVSATRDLFAFAGLSWDPQTSAFLEDSTRHDKSSGYFDVFRASEHVASRWRQSMDMRDQEAVFSVVQNSSLTGYWPGPAGA